MNIIIRQEEEKDRTQVYKINTRAFDKEAEAHLVDLLRTSDAFVPELSLVAEVDGQIVGHILFTIIDIVDTTQEKNPSLSLAPMAVLPEYQHRGIGGELIRKGLKIARELDHRSVIVVGHKDYFPKFGFLPAAVYNLKAPFDVPVNVFMAIELYEDSLKQVSGTVRYAKEFTELV